MSIDVYNDCRRVATCWHSHAQGVSRLKIPLTVPHVNLQGKTRNKATTLVSLPNVETKYAHANERVQYNE